ncbi:MAG: UvrD-helicase domain-containing protein [Bacilli bacterium]|nr:UvrD-helicase domain-containing protein [Bacilli bacterium]
MRINNIELDNTQVEAIKSTNKSVLVIAGAGSGKTLTIQGKVKYLIEELNIKENEILCISFTNETVNNLKNKLLNLGYKIEVLTFHKLGLKFLKNSFSITNDTTLPFIIDEYFKSYISFNKKKNRLFKNLFFTDNDINKIFKSKIYENFKMKIYTFIKLAKSNNLEEKDIYKFYKKSIFNTKILLKFILDIYHLYNIELKSTNSIDLDDIIIKGTKEVKNFKLPYKHIIIDEFQDSSLIRLNLIKEIIKYTNAYLFVVGDDFQSIYRFSGSNLNIFLNFNKYFEDAKYYYLKYTYRNSNELIHVSTNFIMKNKKQLRKNIVSNKNVDKPIKIMINYNLKEVLEITGKENVLILGRNNKDIENIEFQNKMTIHKSKGLEEENVILVNSDDFPSGIKEEKIFKLIQKDKEYIPYEEERRIFYVALTRTKNYIYIIVNNKKSIFIKELIHNYKDYIEIKKKH